MDASKFGAMIRYRKTFLAAITGRWCKIDMWLLLDNRNSYMGSPMAPTHSTLSDLEKSKSKSAKF